MTPTHRLSKVQCARGQSVIEFALILPIILVVVLGVIELGVALLDKHAVTRLAREGSNLISRDTTLEDAKNALRGMSTRPVDFTNGSTVIFSVLKRGSRTGTANFDRLFLYQRHRYGTLANPSMLTTAGSATPGGPPNYEFANPDNNTALRITNAPPTLVVSRGGQIYVTEIYTTHTMFTPLNNFGLSIPSTLYSIAYF
jgi:TadE-like protein